MTNEKQKVWGLHMGEHVGSSPVDKGYVAIGWHELGDLSDYPDRDAFKAAIAEKIPDAKAGAHPVYAGILYRFAHEMKGGDIIVYPSKHDRMVNIGRLTGEISYTPEDDSEYPNHRSVEWLGHFPRNEFSQSALNEIGAFITLFLIKKHRAEFLTKAGLVDEETQAQPYVEIVEENTDDDAATVAVSQQAQVTTDDFVIRRIMASMDGYEFEEFVAHILECMGYTARVTKRSGDGGVDVIAHKDRLGFEPPILKVQCKRKTDQIPRPEVDQLLGTLGDGEFGLFVTLGSFGRQSTDLERNRPKLRLIDGEQFVGLVLEHYQHLSPRYRSIIPLKRIFVPDLPKT